MASFLEARRRRGEWRVRIEDIDTPRVVAGATDAILRSLEAHGLAWDGPVVYQSRRLSRYHWALEQLRRQRRIYACTWSRREIARRVPLGPAGRIYPGFCRSGPRRAGRAEALRVRVEPLVIRVQDALQGELRQNLETEVGDFVVRRADGLFAYQLAVVVDDADQGVDHVVRGSDLLASTPRQCYLQSLLGLPEPDYLHIPVAVDAHGHKLSKQTGAPALDDRRPAPALVAALNFLGQRPPPELTRAGVATVIDWALANWSPQCIPTRTAVGLSAGVSVPA